MISRLSMLVLLIILLSSCQLLQTEQPQEAWITAERLTFDAVSVEYSDYVLADPKLDAFQRANRLALVEDWRIRIATAELVIDLLPLPTLADSE